MPPRLQRIESMKSQINSPARADSWSRALRLQPSHAVIVALTVVIALIGATASENFATLHNLANIQEQMVALGILALAQTVVILSGNIDLSFAGALGVLSVLFAALAGDTGLSLAVAVAVTLITGALIGALNGYVTAVWKVHSLIVTLGVSTMCAGAALLVTKTPAGAVPLFFEDLAYDRIGFVPLGMVLAAGLYAAVGGMLWRTRFGLRVYALGDDARAAAIAGVNTRTTEVQVFALSGVLCAVAAIYITARFGIGDPRAGVGYDLRSITPVIVGGTLLAGGYGGVLGTALAVGLLATLASMLNFINVSSFYQWIVEGVIILAAVIVFARRGRV